MSPARIVDESYQFLELRGTTQARFRWVEAMGALGMPHYYFHMVYDEKSKLDESGYVFSNPNRATEEAVLLLITLALEAQVYGKPVPRKVAILEEGRPRTVLAIKDTE